MCRLICRCKAIPTNIILAVKTNLVTMLTFSRDSGPVVEGNLMISGRVYENDYIASTVLAFSDQYAVPGLWCGHSAAPPT